MSNISEPTDVNHVAKNSYVDSLSENDINRRNLSLVFIDQNNEFYNNKFTFLVSVTVNRNPTTDNDFSIE